MIKFLLILALIQPFLKVTCRAQDMTEPPTLAVLCLNFLEATDPERKLRLLEEIARTPVTTPTDIAKALEVFARYPDEDSRAAVFSAIELTDPRARYLEQAFIAMIKTEEPDAVILGLRGAARLHSTEARPVVAKLAKQKFKKPRPTDLTFATERDQWFAQFEALHALARIDGDAAFDLVVKKTKQTPLAARVLAAWYWEKSLPLFAKWSTGSAAERERAAEGLSAPAPTPALRATREAMLALLRDPKADYELRHQLALKVGLVSSEPEAAALFEEHEKTSDEQTKLMLAAALFASRTRAAVPLLTRYMKENPSPDVRAGARAQLKDSLPPADFRPLLDWAAQNDPDLDQRRAAESELKKLPK